MALKATIFKAELQVSDLDRGHFETHALTIARHPSETDERMMVRLLAFALNADAALDFGKGEALALYLEVAQRDCGSDRTQVLFAFSRAPRTHGAWDELRAIRKATAC